MLLLDAGDFFHGQSMATMNKEKSTVNEYASCEEVLAAYLSPEREQKLLEDILAEGIIERKTKDQIPETREDVEEKPAEDGLPEIDHETAGSKPETESVSEVPKTGGQ